MPELPERRVPEAWTYEQTRGLEERIGARVQAHREKETAERQTAEPSDKYEVGRLLAECIRRYDEVRVERLTGVCADRLGDRVIAEEKDRAFTDEQRSSLKPVLYNLVRRIRESDGKPERASMVKHLVRWGYTGLHRHLATQQQNCLV
ncbi:MAG: hypothetical protein VX005_03850, partial [Pseudomonadota bacterium]|nr:hypothetical protein [Pseudomonadota bacterium]